MSEKKSPGYRPANLNVDTADSGSNYTEFLRACPICNGEIVSVKGPNFKVFHFRLCHERGCYWAIPGHNIFHGHRLQSEEELLRTATILESYREVSGPPHHDGIAA